MTPPLRVDRQKVMAFRLASHHLAHRLPSGSILDAAACGIENFPPGSAALALNARVRDLTPVEVERAITVDRTLIQMRSLRTAPYIVPTRDAGIFTTGLLPEDEESLRSFIPGAGPALDRIGVDGTEVVEWVSEDLLDVLDARVVPFRQLSAELTDRVTRRLSPSQLEGWKSASWYGPNNCLGEAVVHFALYVVALKGTFCFAPREGNEASFVRIDQWLGGPLPDVDPAMARAQLVRRYLRCYGPSTARNFGEWAGISPIATGKAWSLVSADLAEVDFDGKRAWLHRDDLVDFDSPSATMGVRLLPPHDPYLALKDKETLIPDKSLQRRMWRIVGNPGAVLSDGRIVGAWRPQKKGRRLILKADLFESLGANSRLELEAEAVLIAPFKGCSEAEVLYAS